MTIAILEKNRSAKYSLENYSREYTRTYQLVADTYSATEFDVVDALTDSIGAIGTAHPSDSGALLNDVTVNQTEDMGIWTATATWQSQTVRPEHQAIDPTDIPPIFSIDWQIFEEAIEKDLDDQPVVNSAWQPFPNPLVIQRGMPQIKVKINVPDGDFSVGYVTSVMRSVNDDTWLGFPAQTVRIESYSAQQQIQHGVSFWEVNYVLSVNDKSWNPALLDQGYEYLDESGNMQRAMDKYNQPVSQPILLDGAGGKLDTEADDPFFINFRTHNAIDFDAIFGT